MKKAIVRRSQSSFSTIDSMLESVFHNRNSTVVGENDYTLKNLIKPTLMRGLDAALDILSEAANKQSRILIVGDFDADGATSTAVAISCLHAFGFSHVDYLVPNRFEYGYGLTPEIVGVAKGLNPEIIITVDNGISSVAGVAAAKNLGIRVIVTDHHLPGEELPEADAIVNPNQHGCEFSSKNLAGVGVIFYVMSALRTRLDGDGWFESRKIPVPNMADYLDLVALGTVADVVPLDLNNRILVSQGIARMRRSLCRPGIQALFNIANRAISRANAGDLGFALGPRLNAAGRLDDMSLGIRCLLSHSEREAMSLVQELDDLNSDRKSIESSMQAEALKFVGDFNELDSTDFPSGV